MFKNILVILFLCLFICPALPAQMMVQTNRNSLDAMVDTLVVMERRTGEASHLGDRGFYHYIKFPEMTWVRKDTTYWSTDWISNNTNYGNDSGQSTFTRDSMYQVNCTGRQILRLTKEAFPDFVILVSGLDSPQGYPDTLGYDTFRPVGVTRKGTDFFVLEGATIALIKYDSHWNYVSKVALDGTTYDEHDGIVVQQNGKFLSATSKGYIVEFDETSTYTRNVLIDSDNVLRGAALWHEYFVTCKTYIISTDTCDAKVVLLKYPDLTVLSTTDLSSHLNAVGNSTYGCYFMKKKY